MARRYGQPGIATCVAVFRRVDGMPPAVATWIARDFFAEFEHYNPCYSDLNYSDLRRPRR